MDTQTKAQMEAEHSAKMNEEAVKRIKEETLTQEEADRIEAVFFEDDEVLKLRDGKVYKIAPLSLKNSRKFMKLLKTVNVDAIILNFVPSGNDELDNQKQDNLFEILEMAFSAYKLDRDYLDEFVDLNTAKKVIDTLIGLNGIKK